MTLKIISLILGAVFAAAGLMAALKPEAAGRILKAFPRNKAAGWILTAVCIAWSGWLIYEMPLGGLERFKNLLYVLIPASFYMIITHMGELLAARSFGALLMLIPYPMLISAQFHPSPFRYVIIALAFIMVIKGMALTLSPYLFRRYAGPVFESAKHTRTAGILCAAWGIFLIVLAIVEFPHP